MLDEVSTVKLTLETATISKLFLLSSVHKAGFQQFPGWWSWKKAENKKGFNHFFWLGLAWSMCVIPVLLMIQLNSLSCPRFNLLYQRVVGDKFQIYYLDVSPTWSSPHHHVDYLYRHLITMHNTLQDSDIDEHGQTPGAVKNVCECEMVWRWSGAGIRIQNQST